MLRRVRRLLCLPLPAEVVGVEVLSASNCYRGSDCWYLRVGVAEVSTWRR
jgi:hypothetical protein